jgi:hypothetical protein
MERDRGLMSVCDASGEEFLRGLEIGRLWEQLRSEEPVQTRVRAANVELLLRMSAASSRPLKADAVDETWLLARFQAPAWAAG